MNPTFVQQILNEYDADINSYTDYTNRLHALVADIMKINNIAVHSVTKRTKDRPSLQKKLTRPDSNYEHLTDITDITGVRIITYFSDEVDQVAKIIEGEFGIDPQNSVDKRALLDPDRFGYLSVHYVVKLPPHRATLVEYKRFSLFSAEIQIRSILQHAWAEIEHDLGYKSKIAVPKDIRRQFSQLSSLLELADQQFVSIRNTLQVYEAIVLDHIANQPQKVLIDLTSLTAFISSNQLMKDLDHKIADRVSASVEEEISSDFIESLLIRFKLVGIETIEQLEANLSRCSALVINYALDWLSKNNNLSPAICLHYLAYVLIAEHNDPSKVLHFINVSNLGKEEERGQLVERIIGTYKKISS